jgi:hypothetical protein
MRPIVLTKTGTGASSGMAVMDHYQTPFNAGIGVVVSGTVNYTIQHTFDDVLDEAVTPAWFNHPTLASQTAAADGNYAFPVRAVRVFVNSGSGTATATVIQAGMPGR